MLKNGETWKDSEGHVLHAHGGGLLKADDTYYWFGENRTGGIKVSCYRSSDLMNWQFSNHVLTVEAPFESIEVKTHPEMIIEGATPRYGIGVTIERPKVLYNKKTKKYVMWMHWENGIHYNEARCAVASCDRPDGEYTYHGSFNPIGHMSRDCTLFQDEDGTAYFISAARGNADMHIYRLSDDYMTIAEHMKTLWPGQYREAPALFRRGSYYFMITSGCSAWNPNQMKYAYAKQLSGSWSDLYFLADATSYDTQPTYVLPLQGTEGTSYLYVGDRWNPTDYYKSGYAILPLAFPTEHSIELSWCSRIRIDAARGMVQTEKSTYDWIRISSSGNRKYVEAAVDNGSIKLGLLDYSRQEQIWKLDQAGNGAFRIVNRVTGRCMVPAVEDRNDRIEIIQADRAEGPEQYWVIEEAKCGWHNIRNQAFGYLLSLLPGEGEGVVLIKEQTDAESKPINPLVIVSPVREEWAETRIDFHKWMQPVPQSAVFTMPGWQVWCSTMVRTKDGLCHMLFSRWPEEHGHAAWVTHSEIAYAVADHPLGPYTFRHTVFSGSGGLRWDADVVHNPTMIEADGKYYLYYMGNRGNGEFWDHRNNQRIGVAWAEHPAGPWHRFDQPLIDVSHDSWDHVMVSNPTVARGPDGKFIMVYKGVGKGAMPKGGAVNCGVAIADHPLGPFRKIGGPIMVNPEHDWSVEDPFIWWQQDRFYALVKDFQGYFAKDEKGSVALFESTDGIDWAPSVHPYAFKREIAWDNGVVQKVNALERPQVWLEDGEPSVLFCAAALDADRKFTCCVQIPLQRPTSFMRVDARDE